MQQTRLNLLLMFICTLCFTIQCFAEENVFTPNQSSAHFLVKQAEIAIDKASPENRELAVQKHALVFGIYIKARSYAILNKIFFWLAVSSAISVFLWPSVSVIFASKTESWKWLKSATVQTTVTGIAAFTFAFYSQYKDKQVYAESLMRYVIYSEDSIQVISSKVSEELSKIDRGFSFNSVVKTEGKQ